jgi:hypothetical protein
MLLLQLLLLLVHYAWRGMLVKAAVAADTSASGFQPASAAATAAAAAAAYTRPSKCFTLVSSES